MFRTAFYLAKSERPFRDFPGLLSLQDINYNDTLGNHYANDKQAKTFISYMGEENNNNISQMLNQNSFISVICDGSTDKGIIEEEIVFARFLNHECVPETKFISLESVHKADAEGLKGAVGSALEKKVNCKDWREKLVGIATDGAAVNFGCREGLVAKLRTKIPHLIGIRCCAHRLELALKDAARKSKLWDTIDAFLSSLYKFYHYSSLNMDGLMEAGKALKITILRPGNIWGTRWVPHRHRALLAVDRDWLALANHLSQVAMGTNETAAKAKGLHLTLVSVHFVLMLHVALKFFSICRTISEVFQDNDSSVETLYTTLQAAQLKLASDRFDAKGVLKSFVEKDLVVTGTDVMYRGERLKLQSGSSRGRQHTLDTALEDVEKSVSCMVSATAEALNQRFASFNDPVLKAFRVFEPMNWPHDIEVLADFGTTEIQTITNHFSDLLNRNGTDTTSMEIEWTQLLLSCRELKREQPDRCIANNERFQAFWKKVLQTYNESQRFANILTLVKIMLVLPIHSAEAERGFSLMGRVKNDWRSRLHPETTSNLMALKLANTTVESFDPMPSINRWWTDTKRTRRFTQQYGTRASADIESNEEQMDNDLVSVADDDEDEA
ncbi:zinc finger protein 862-like [Patiria miniata]|uniref:HAT C-terminal dimerisation domain-containing protein n=1 Tax=Patiria miniata TaxID=46514 RepID=A0A914ASJ0_PATMI|nr:zinc finger protein 862-like [Patiria miniata]